MLLPAAAKNWVYKHGVALVSLQALSIGKGAILFTLNKKSPLTH